MAETERAAPGGGRGGAASGRVGCLNQFGEDTDPDLAAQAGNPSMLAAALGYAARGWRVFPLRGNLPRIVKGHGGKGVHDATTDPAVIRAWSIDWLEANVGPVTGTPSDLNITATGRRASIERPSESPGRPPCGHRKRLIPSGLDRPGSTTVPAGPNPYLIEGRRHSGS